MKTVLCAVIAATMLFVPAAFAEDIAPVALNSLSATPAKIAAAPVYDQQGRVIGKVKAVVADQDGRPAAISYIATTTSKLVIVAAPAVSYDEQNNLLVTESTPQQLAAN